MQGPPVNPTLSDDDVRKVATLSKLAVADGAIDAERTKLEAVLGYVERLRELDLEGVEPMTRASDEPARLRDDTPGEPLKGDALANLAPDLYEHQQVDAEGEAQTERFIRVPKVLGEGGA
jgi:aspartyl-tRNA(Asn)/glutamyl-tRNA(Gln) amidotransferase subunit C